MVQMFFAQLVDGAPESVCKHLNIDFDTRDVDSDVVKQLHSRSICNEKLVLGHGP